MENGLEQKSKRKCSLYFVVILYIQKKIIGMRRALD